METVDLVIDTSIIIEHLRKQDKQKSVLFRIFTHYTLHVPTVVEFELYAGATNRQKERDLQEILSNCNILPFTSAAARQAATLFQSLRRSNQLIETRDLLIAATALANNLPLMTLNDDHFKRISTLQLIQPPS